MAATAPIPIWTTHWTERQCMFRYLHGNAHALAWKDVCFFFLTQKISLMSPWRMPFAHEAPEAWGSFHCTVWTNTDNIYRGWEPIFVKTICKTKLGASPAYPLFLFFSFCLYTCTRTHQLFFVQNTFILLFFTYYVFFSQIYFIYTLFVLFSPITGQHCEN